MNTPATPLDQLIASLPKPARPLPPGPRPVPLCQAWGTYGGTCGVVHRDAAGVCMATNIGGHDLLDVRLTAKQALELAVRLVAQADAWTREFGRGDGA